MGVECPWVTISGFQRPSEFQRFEDWMIGQIEAGAAREVPVRSAFSGGSFREKWFLHPDSNQTWRLVWPDPPFKGVFERV
jgi:hypothetical protein